MNSLMVPIVLWGQTPPTHKIRSIAYTEGGKNIITGCADGQVCIWDVDTDEFNIKPRALLFGHTSSVVSIASVLEDSGDSRYFLTASSSNELFLWDLADCHCVEHTKISGSPTKLIPLQLNVNGKSTSCVACIGLFAEVFIISCMSLNNVTTLISRIYPDWISSCTVTYNETEANLIGLTLSGTIKVWQLPNTLNSSTPILEDESKQLRCVNAVDLSHDPSYGNILLAVSPYEWQLYDARDFSLICSHRAPRRAVLSGGDILRGCDKVALWDQSGKVYIYNLKFTGGGSIPGSTVLLKDKKIELLYSFSSSRSNMLSQPPVFLLHSSFPNEFVIYSGNSKGIIDIWSISKEKLGNVGCKSDGDFVSLKCSYSLSDHWDCLVRPPSGIIDNLSKNSQSSVTTSLYLENIGQLACGRDDGSIIIVPAARACKSQLIRDGPMTKRCWVPHRTLRGHLDRITCLLYPHQESDRYSPEIFVSGSADFSVIMWELFTGAQLHVFNVHGGEITELIVPPEECSSRIQQSVCSVATDHSVALLSVRERKCVMLAASHTSMVTTIKWRPLDDFLLVSCADGGLFVWQMETGHLDRHLTGVTAAEILHLCDESQGDTTVDVSQNNINISQMIRRKNLSGFKAAAQQGLRTIIESIEEKVQDGEVDSENRTKVSCPRAMVVQPIRASVTHDDDSHVFFFNTEAIIGTLLQEQAIRKKMAKTKRISENGGHQSSAKKVINAFIYQVKNQLLDSSDPASSATSTPNPTRKRRDKKMEIDSIIDIAQLLLSCLHGWGLDKNLDVICKTKLGIFEPVAPVSFGLLSRDGQVSLLLPTWANPRKLTVSHSSNNSNECNHMLFQVSYQQAANGHAGKCSHRSHWEISSAVTTNHLLSIIAVSNTLMELSNVKFTDNKAPRRTDSNGNEDSTSEAVSESYFPDPVDNSHIKQGWALLATLHCVLLQELLASEHYKPPQLELLARRWQDRCLEVREAAQALLLAKLRHIESKGRREIVKEWSRYMPDYIHQQHIDLVPNTRTDESTPSNSHSTIEDGIDRSSVSSVELVSEVSPLSARSNLQKMSYEARRRQATAVIILGVIGAEFGQEMGTPQSNPSSPAKPATKDDVPDGFKLTNYSLARNTCKALVYLLLHPASTRLPAHAPIRRAAIDLLGRGFTVWEPYIEVSAVLLGLLELCVDYDLHKASIHSGLPLSAKADSCRSSHHALCLIATARPQTFITTIAREVARHNAASANPQHQALLATSIILRSRGEILRIIELLAEKSTHDVSGLLVEVMDIVIFCIDTNNLRTSNSLVEAVPALSRFHCISYDPRSRRIAVGTKQGAIYLYDLRSNKNQRIFKGRHTVTTVAFSPDGKYLSAYSVQDNHLSFWTTSSSLFGMLQSQVKCVKTLRLLPATVSQRLAAAPDLNRDSMRNFMKLAWVSNRTTVLLLSDGNEYRSHV